MRSATAPPARTRHIWRHADCAGAGDHGAGECDVRCLELGQRRHRFKLQRELGAAACIASAGNLGEEALVASQVLEIARAAQIERFAQCRLEIAVGGFDAAMFVADAGIIAGRLNGVMRAEGIVSGSGVILVDEIAIVCRQTIGAMRLGRAAQVSKRFLHALGERGEALLALDRLDVLPAGELEREVVMDMRKRRAGDRHLEHSRVGEIGERLLTRWMLLAEDQLALES